MAGIIKANTIQLGDSATATQNFVLQTNVDGTAKLARGNQGATTQDILTIDANGLVTLTQGRQLTNSTAITTTSGTTAAFTSIPSWVKRITMNITGMGTSGTNRPIIQLGSTTFTTTGYVGAVSALAAAAVTTIATDTNGASLNTAWASTVRQSGSIVFSLQTGNTWDFSGQMGRTDAVQLIVVSGSIPLAGVLDRIQLTTTTGTDTFTAGSVNIMYEG